MNNISWHFYYDKLFFPPIQGSISSGINYVLQLTEFYLL